MQSVAGGVPSTLNPPDNAKRFYRPELDALRFFAFLAVLIHHGPGAPGVPDIIKGMGGFGLSMFFLLSAYLITELLVREREKSGSVAWGFFFIRRALRIWPLYFFAIAAAVGIGKFAPPPYRMTSAGIVSLCLFVANWMQGDIGRLLAPLWSISIEEQFYLLWPPILKWGGQTLAFAVSVLFVISAGAWLLVYADKGWKLWYDTPVQFLFFAAGALMALGTRRKSAYSMRNLDRIGLLIAGLVCIVVAAMYGGVGTALITGLTRGRLFIGYGGAVIGCTAIFAAALGVSRVPRVLIYPGKISYGLYVFHGGMMQVSIAVISPFHLARASVSNMIVVDSAALLLCLLAAHLSYEYLERPFLRLKERFEVVKSRPV